MSAINNKSTSLAAADAAFASLRQSRQPRQTTLAQGLAAEDQATNPWNGKPRSSRYFDLLKQRRDLPASAATARGEFLAKFQENNVMIIIGETRSGKTTQTPQHILYDELPEVNGKLIACTQPCRLAASQSAARVAEELDVTLGEEVGYEFMGQSKKGRRTRLIYAPDGHLLAQVSKDEILSAYSCIIIDEAHKRTVATDLLLGGLKTILEVRKDLKVIIMSATLKAGKTFEKFFPGSAVHIISGKKFGVDVGFTLSSVPDYVVAATRAVRHILVTQPLQGDILVFVPGEDDIENVIAGIRHQFTVDIVCLPLHAKLSESQKQLALKPDESGRRKCIVATDIAETSLTVDGIVFVVDTGLTKVKTWNPRIRLSASTVALASKNAIQQRLSHAGRTCPGVAFELLSEEVFNTVAPDDALPAILSTELSRTVLQVLAMKRSAKVEDLRSFAFLNRPSGESLLQAIDDLTFLGCLDSHGQITAVGRLALSLPLEPRRAVTVIKAAETTPSVLWEMAAVLSLMEEGDLWHRYAGRHNWDAFRDSFTDNTGDHMAWLYMFRAYKDEGNVSSASQLENWCDQRAIKFSAMTAASDTWNNVGRILRHAKASLHMEKIPADRIDARRAEISIFFRKMLLHSSFLNIAVYEKGNTYRTLSENQPGLVHPSSTLIVGTWDFVVYEDFIDTSSKPYFCGVSGIDPQWLFEVPEAAVYMEELLADPHKKNLFAIKKLVDAKAKCMQNSSTA